MADQPQHKDAVLSQVFLNEATQQFLVIVILDLAHETEVLLDVARTVGAEYGPKRPREETQTGHGRHKDHPEPEEQVDLLVEQVDGQHALHGVALHVAESPHLQVAHGDAREARRLGPVLAPSQLLHHVDSVHAELCAEERVEEVQLADDVADEEELHPKVEGNEVVASDTSTHDAEGAGEDVL